MEFLVHHTVLGECILSDKNPKGSVSFPVLLSMDGKTYGPKDPKVRSGNIYPETPPGYTQDYLNFVRKFNAQL